MLVGTMSRREKGVTQTSNALIREDSSFTSAEATSTPCALRARAFSPVVLRVIARTL